MTWTDEELRVYIHRPMGHSTPFSVHVTKQLVPAIRRWLDGFDIDGRIEADQCKIKVVSKSKVNLTCFILEPAPNGILISCRTVRLTRKLKSRRWEEKGSVSVSYSHNLPKQMNILQRQLWSRYAEPS